MSATGNEPVSAENLKMIMGGIPKETVLFEDRDNASGSVTLSEPMDSFDVLRILVRWTRSGNYQEVYYNCFESFVSDVKRQHGFMAFFETSSSGGVNNSISGSGTTLSLSGASQGLRIVRVTGIKSGGAVLGFCPCSLGEVA